MAHAEEPNASVQPGAEDGPEDMFQRRRYTAIWFLDLDGAQLEAQASIVQTRCAGVPRTLRCLTARTDWREPCHLGVKRLFASLISWVRSGSRQHHFSPVRSRYFQSIGLPETLGNLRQGHTKCPRLVSPESITSQSPFSRAHRKLPVPPARPRRLGGVRPPRCVRFRIQSHNVEVVKVIPHKRAAVLDSQLSQVQEQIVEVANVAPRTSHPSCRLAIQHAELTIGTNEVNIENCGG